MSKTKKLKPLKPEQLVQKFLGELEHFFVPGCGGWPIVLESQVALELCQRIPALVRTGNK